MRLPPASVRQLFNRTRRFLEFIAERLGTCDLARVDQALLDAYCVHLSSAPQRRSIQVAHLLELIPDLHRFREHMPSGGLQLLPWKGRSAYIVAGSKQTVGENKTPRLPEEIISPLLQWALKYISPLQREVIESDLKRYRNVIRKTSISHQHVRLTNEVTRKQT